MSKVFSEKQVSVSAVLGGPIPPGILIYQNYKALGNERAANFTLAGTLIFTAIFFYAIFQIPSAILDKVPDFEFTAFYGLIVYLFFRHYMAEDTNKAVEEGALKQSNWSVAGLTLLGIIINVVIILGLAMDQPFYESEMITENGNELYFEANVPTDKVKDLAEILKTQDFFGEDYGNIARIEYAEGQYYITFVVEESMWNNQDIMAYFTSIKWQIESEWEQNISLKLESVNLAGKSSFKYIDE